VRSSEFIPNLNLYIVTCIDCRVDPAQVLGARLGEALVQRNIGGRITPAVIADIAYAGYLVDTKPREGPYFEAAIVHTDCGSTLLADDELRHGVAQRIGTDERTLADTPVLDPARTVRKLLENITIAALNGAEQAARLAEVVARTGLDPWGAHAAAIADAAVCPTLTLNGAKWREHAADLDEPLHIIEIADLGEQYPED
jgi:carbonic anhydrase